MKTGLQDYLANRDVPCPSCGYNLRGLSKDRCPECGAVVLDELEKVSRDEPGMALALAGTGLMILIWIALIVWSTVSFDPLSLIALWVPLLAGLVVVLTLIAVPRSWRLRSKAASLVATGIVSAVALFLVALIILLFLAMS